MTLIMALTLAGFAQDEELTPARALELLEETRRLMRQAEERLNEAQPGKAEKHERGAADRLAELIRKASSLRGPSVAKANQRRDPPTGPQEASKFRGPTRAWGRLPATVRGILLESDREEVPPEFQELWRRYRESIESFAR
jgi:hypothetical protein